MKAALLLACVIAGTTKGQNTNFIDKDSKLLGYAEPKWFVDNIPFLDLPDSTVEDVYYYRWSSLKRHLRYTLPGAGYIVTEFVHKVHYSQKFDTINAAAGHHIDETKWLRNSRYVKDYINVWAREGAGAQQYSEWIADAAYNAYLLNADADFIKSMQEGFINNYNGWSPKFEETLNLYHITPHDDAMEHSASSEQTDDPYHGGLGYRPSFNSEMYANALAISKIARMNGDLTTADLFENKAADIRNGILTYLWDPERQFFYHVFREDNPNLDLLDAREEIGFFPWRWGVPPTENPEYDTAWEHLFDPEGFNSAFGPTTCEQRSQWFDGNQTSQCCWWNGNSWPYSTGHTLRSLAAQIKNYRTTQFANIDSFMSLLNQYARTQYKNGKPYVAECHSPLYDFWVCDGRNHSEHYAHSTYNDNVLTDLMGIVPQANNTLQVNPLTPRSWTYWAVENVLYHGHNVTILYDQDGRKYNTGYVGMQAFVNGQLVGIAPAVGIMTVFVPPPITDPSYPNQHQRMENYATNVKSFGYPMPEASFSSLTDSSVWQAIDGRVFYDFIPSNRWSNYGNDINAVDWFAIDFGPGRAKTVDQVKLYVYSDFATGEGGVDCPTSVFVEYWSPSGGTWSPTQNQSTTPTNCIPNDVWVINFDPVSTQKIRLLFANNVQQETYIGIGEIEIWASWPQAEEGVYEAEDGYLLDESEIRPSLGADGGSFVDIPISSSLEFTGVWADAVGNYTLSFRYTNGGESDATWTLDVNNVEEKILLFPTTTTDWDEFGNNFVNITCSLQRGNNVLILKNGGQTIQIDRVGVDKIEP